jgi:membrane-associated phospholipid phosphatase
MKTFLTTFHALLIALCCIVSSLRAQNLTVKDSTGCNTAKGQFCAKQLIIPGVLIGYGFAGLNSHWVKGLNRDIRDRVRSDIDDRITIDDFSRYVPVVSVYALNAAGVKGKHGFKDRTVILVTSFILVNSTVLSLKSLISAKRPDGTSDNSFPSGHSATAFAGAEFLWQEYKDVSLWYGIGGYIIATGTGIFRIYNDRHWLSDVAAGAGIGILGTKAAYWLNPYLSRKLFGSDNARTTMHFTPFYDGTHTGCILALHF